MCVYNSKVYIQGCDHVEVRKMAMDLEIGKTYDVEIDGLVTITVICKDEKGDFTLLVRGVDAINMLWEYGK